MAMAREIQPSSIVRLSHTFCFYILQRWKFVFNGKYSTIHTYNFTLLHAILSIVQTTCILYYIYMYLITAPRSMTLSLL